MADSINTDKSRAAEPAETRQHTDGPWAQFIDRYADLLSIHPAGRGGTIATLKLSENGDANAHLIAAAPELLSNSEKILGPLLALQAWIEVGLGTAVFSRTGGAILADIKDRIAGTRAVIAKARGIASAGSLPATDSAPIASPSKSTTAQSVLTPDNTEA